MWVRAGDGEASGDDCGKPCRALRCVHHEQPVFYGTPHTCRIVFHSCNHPTCPVCVHRWAHREAAAATPRLLAVSGLYQGVKGVAGDASRYIGRLKHAVFSPPRVLWAHLSPETATAADYRTLRRLAIAAAKVAGILGGTVVFHPWRGGHRGEPWYWSPHFHILGYGRLRNAREYYQQTGWVYRNYGYRKSVAQTVSYELDHCGVCEGVHTLVWFGILSYNKMRTVYSWSVQTVQRCEACGAKVYAYPLLSDGTPDYSDGVPNVVWERRIIYDLKSS